MNSREYVLYLSFVHIIILLSQTLYSLFFFFCSIRLNISACFVEQRDLISWKNCVITIVLPREVEERCFHNLAPGTKLRNSRELSQ